MAIYTDSPSETVRMAADVSDVRIYQQSIRMEACRKIKAAPCAVAGKSLGLGNKYTTFYIGNNEAKCGLTISNSKVPIPTMHSRTFSEIVAYQNSTLWIERADSRKNIYRIYPRDWVFSTKLRRG